MLIGFAQDVCMGLSIIHTKGLVHCDIKPQNILVEVRQRDRLNCVITDFGISTIVDRTSLLVAEFKVVNIRANSAAYAAPEVFRHQARPVKHALDIYSFAVLLYFTLTVKNPWSSNRKRIY